MGSPRERIPHREDREVQERAVEEKRVDWQTMKDAEKEKPGSNENEEKTASNKSNEINTVYHIIA